MEKFKVGQKVYCIRRGLGEISLFPVYKNKDITCVRVSFPERDSAEFNLDGTLYDTDVNPTLLTLEEARAKGYAVPKQKIVKEIEVYLNHYKDGQGYTYASKSFAECAPDLGGRIITAYPVTIKYEVEE